jgi:hypothetical protein
LNLLRATNTHSLPLKNLIDLRRKLGIIFTDYDRKFFGLKALVIGQPEELS